jgi:hypothetical protein
MWAFLVLLFWAFWSIPAKATVLTNTSTFKNPTVVDDWSMLNYANGEDGPVYIRGLRIESLNNSPEYNEIGNYLAEPATGFPDDADGYVSALNANLLRTDFLFTFPGEVKQAGLYLRETGAFDVQALDSSRNILASDRVTLTNENLVAFRGFSGLPEFRSIRVTEINSDYYSTQFDEVQWQPVPEPSASALLLTGALLTAMLGYRRRVQSKAPGTVTNMISECGSGTGKISNCG